jgi:hypothetical protein
MAADFIKIDRNDNAAPFAGEIISAVAQLRTAQDTLLKIQAKGFRMFDTVPDPDDFSVFETNYGIPTGSGQTVFNLVNGTVIALAGTGQNANAQELINRVG